MIRAKTRGGHNSAEQPRARAGSRALAAASLLILSLPVALGDADAKTPGRVYCYHGVCHRVHGVEEVSRLVGDIRQETASYYGTLKRARASLRRTSSGETFNAASRHRVSSSIYPDGTELLLWNPRNGRTAHVRVNDLGPFHGRRTLDLTQGLADDLGFRVEGVTPLHVFVISPPDAQQARHDPKRVFPPTGGYLGTLDENGVRALADDLVDVAMQQVAMFRPAAPVEPQGPVGETPEIAITGGAPADTPLEPAIAPIVVAANMPKPPQTAADVPPAEIPAAAAAASEPRAPDSTAVPAKAAEAVVPPLPAAPATPAVTPPAPASVAPVAVATPQATSPALLSPLASGASRHLLLLAFVMTLATLLLARVRRPDHIVAGIPTGEAPPRALPKPSDASLTVAFRRLAPDTAPDPLRGDAATDAIDGLGLRRHARYLMDAGEPARAEEMIRHLLETSEATLGATHCDLAGPLKLWADCVRDLGRHDDARQIYARALTLAVAAGPESAALVAQIREERARLDLAGQRFAAAANDAHAAAALHRESGTPARATASLLLVAEARHGAGDIAAAEHALREVLSLVRPAEQIAACEAAVGLAHILAARGDSGEALQLARDALSALNAHLGLLGGSQAARNLDPVADFHAIDIGVQLRRRAIELIGELSGAAPSERGPLATLI